MKVQIFLDALARYHSRAEMFFPTKEFSDQVFTRAAKVSDPLAAQFRVGLFNHVSQLPPDGEMCEEAEAAFRELCAYLQEHDSEGGYNAFCPSVSTLAMAP